MDYEEIGVLEYFLAGNTAVHGTEAVCTAGFGDAVGCSSDSVGVGSCLASSIERSCLRRGTGIALIQGFGATARGAE
eukprot:IDg2170t1